MYTLSISYSFEYYEAIKLFNGCTFSDIDICFKVNKQGNIW